MPPKLMFYMHSCSIGCDVKGNYAQYFPAYLFTKITPPSP